MKGSFWKPDRKILSRKSEIFLQIVAKKSKEMKSCSLKTLLEIKQSSSNNLIWKKVAKRPKKKRFSKPEIRGKIMITLTQVCLLKTFLYRDWRQFQKWRQQTFARRYFGPLKIMKLL